MVSLDRTWGTCFIPRGRAAVVSSPAATPVSTPYNCPSCPFLTPTDSLLAALVHSKTAGQLLKAQSFQLRCILNILYNAKPHFRLYSVLGL